MIPLRDDLGKRGPVPATLVLLGALVAVHALVWQLPEAALHELQTAAGLRPAAVCEAWARLRGARPSEVIRGLPALLQAGVLPFVSYTFLHAGIVHLLGNVLFGWVFGSRLEARAGWRRFLLFWVLAGAAAGLAQVLHQPTSAVPVVGASGAIAAAMGAYLLFWHRARVLLLIPVVVVPVFVELPVLVLVVAWAALQLEKVQQLLAIGAAEPVAYAAHLGGLGAGLVTAPLLLRRRHPATAGERVALRRA